MEPQNHVNLLRTGNLGDSGNCTAAILLCFVVTLVRKRKGIQAKQDLWRVPTVQRRTDNLHSGLSGRRQAAKDLYKQRKLVFDVQACEAGQGLNGGATLISLEDTSRSSPSQPQAPRVSSQTALVNQT